MAQFLPSLTPARGPNGSILAGAIWEFYRKGTTTPQAIDGGGTSATSDSEGSFATINLAAGQNYRAVLKSADGRVLYDVSSDDETFFDAGVKAAIDASSNAVSGSTWSFYTTGTTTPQSVYADPDLQVSLGSVVTANADGVFPEIHLDTNVTYKAVLDVNGEQTTIDPVGEASIYNFLVGVGDSLAFGQSAIYNAGTDGTFFVDAINGDNGNAGTSAGAAKATIGAALTAANSAGGDQVIRVMGDGVKYRETIDFSWTNASLTSLAIKGYSTDRPIISGGESLTGWAACVSGDSAVVGANWASIYKLTVAKSSFPAAKYWRCILREGSTPLTICGIRRAGRTFPDFFTDNIDQTIETDETTGLTFGLRSGVWYDTITHTGTLDSYTDTQLEQTTAVLHVFPNETRYGEVISVASSVLQLESLSVRPADGGANGAYALLNVLPTIQQGQWGYRDDGAGNVTFYVWPNDAANLTANMELAVRNEGMRIVRTLSNCPVEIEGINFEMFAGGGTRDQCLQITGNSGTTSLTGNTGLVKECKFSLFSFGPTSTGAGRAFDAKFVEQGITVQNVTIQDGIGFGITTTPSSTLFLSDFRAKNILVEDVSQAGLRMFGIRDAVLQDCRAVRTSGGGHANLVNFYQGCDNVVCQNFQGGITDATRAYEGYGTNQSSSRIYLLHCTFTLGSDGRGYVDQTVTGEVLPTVGADSYMINCWVPHMPDRLAAADSGGITLTRDVHDWHCYNTITPALLKSSGSTGTLTRKNNILTNSTATGDASETLVSVAALHTDAANDDWSPASGSILNTKAGFDVESVIATLEAAFPGEDFRRDARGDPWNPATPGVGPYGRNWA